jgi:hypothetical protein
MMTWTTVDDTGFHALVAYDRPNFRIHFKCGKVQQDTARRFLLTRQIVPGLDPTDDLALYCGECMGIYHGFRKEGFSR